MKSVRLVILTTRFEAPRGIFWYRPRNFELRSNEEEACQLATPSPNFHATPTGARLATTYYLACIMPHTRRIFSGNGFRTWNPPAPKPTPYRPAWAS
ncbi:hypothetical protein AVEN_150224-1 [Araneus ventricosus]|uniref:Uncharacterized protein n=1 Tax=Araneus ventricosus TaxID=182803 RepID=A0A4Y2G4M6_ARAVE|nr:hypothetical protein AVEN_150224-1 [Araneus ventricosus]